jgi:hypothetical protein
MPAQRLDVWITLTEFRGKNLHSGIERIGSRSQLRWGARWRGRASCNSFEVHAETDAARFTAADESAPTSAAHAARCEADAALADSTAQEAAALPKIKAPK